jgi:hypothetical protein
VDDLKFLAEDAKTEAVDLTGRCATCKYWLMPTDPKAVGECRRNPPTVFMLIQPAQPISGKLDIPGMRGAQAMSQAQMNFVSKWPPVPAGAGCGEWSKDA